MYKLSEKGRQFILDWETGGGVSGAGRMILDPWEDPEGSGRYSVGAGHNFSPADKPEYMTGISREKAWELFESDIQWVQECINQVINVNLNQNQVDALGSFIYTTGCDPDTGLVRIINEDCRDCKSRLKEKWEKYVHSGGNRISGLVKRRDAEIELFFSDPGPMQLAMGSVGLSHLNGFWGYAITILLIILILLNIFKR